MNPRTISIFRLLAEIALWVRQCFLTSPITVTVGNEMTQKTEKYWYQDGTMLILLLVAGCFFSCLILGWIGNVQKRADAKDVMLPRFSGRISRSFWGEDHFVLQCVHKFPGNLNQGRISFRALGVNVKGVSWTEIESFETWQPNAEGSKTFYFPIKEQPPEGRIDLELVIEASNAPTATYETIWENGKWKTSVKKVPNK